MARVALTKTTLARNLTGSVLTDASPAVMATGSANGRYWVHSPTDLIVLINDTGGPAVFTFVPTTPAAWAQVGVTVPSATITVADGKTVLLRAADILQNASGQLLMDCDVAGKLIVYDCAG